RESKLGELPTLAEFRLQKRVCLAAVREVARLGVPIQLAFADSHSDHAEQHPLREWAGDAEVRACRLAALAGADPVAVMTAHPFLLRSGGAGEQLRRQLVILHARGRNQSRILAVTAGGHHSFVADEEA